jgi:YggT family protein
VHIAISLIANTAAALLSIIQICMFLRAVLSWFPIQDNNPILSFVYMVTEPVVVPVRALFERLGWFRNSPLDISFLVAFMLISLISGFFGVMV